MRKQVNYMKLNINGKVVNFNSTEKDVAQLFETIEMALKEDNLELSHLLIDGTPVYQDLEQFIEENYATIKEISLVTFALQALINDTLTSAFEYAGKATSILKSLSEAFYQSPDQEDWQVLADLFEGIDWLIDSMNRIDQIENLQLYLTDYTIWNEYVLAIKGSKLYLKELEQAMINKDEVLIGDLILYEILPIFESAREKLGFLVSDGGEHVS